MPPKVWSYCVMHIANMTQMDTAHHRLTAAAAAAAAYPAYPAYPAAFPAAYPAAASDCNARRPVSIQHFDWLSPLVGRCCKRVGQWMPGRQSGRGCVRTAHGGLAVLSKDASKASAQCLICKREVASFSHKEEPE